MPQGLMEFTMLKTPTSPTVIRVLKKELDNRGLQWEETEMPQGHAFVVSGEAAFVSAFQSVLTLLGGIFDIGVLDGDD